MKIRVKRYVEIEVDRVRVCLPVRYEEEDIPNDFPLRNGDQWTGTIRLSDGQILEWPEGAKGGKMEMKVCDSGEYVAISSTGKEFAPVRDYVPDCIPEGGDYIEFNIDDSGRITNWNPRADFSTLLENEKD